jgi:hypothetical protein
MRIITFLFTLLISIASYSQSWQWANSRPFPSYVERTNVITVDPFGNSFISGQRNYGTLYEYFISKFDVNGNLLWDNASTSYGWINNIATDSSGNLYAQLFTTPFNGMAYDQNDGGLFVKFDPYGNVLWVRQINARMLFSEKSDHFNNIMCTGPFVDTVDIGNGHILYASETEDEQYIAKFDVNGDCIWSQQNDGGRYPLAINEKGDMFAWAELYTGVTTVGQGASQVTLNPADGDEYFAKYDSTGALIWVKQPNASMITGDNFGNAYIFEAGYIKKYDPSGTQIWQRGPIYAGDWYKAQLKCNANGDLLFAGGFSSSLTIDDTTITVTGTKSFVAKIDSSGTLLWITVSGGSGNAGAKDISIGDDGAIYITGDMSGTVCFGSNCTTQPNGVFAAKLLDVPSSATAVLPKTTDEASLTVSPNPGSGIFNLSYSGKAAKLTIEIRNATGQLIWSANENNPAGIVKKTIDLSAQPRGIYFLKVMVDGESSSKKIVLN